MGSGKNKHIQVLLVEDNEADAMLVLIQLRQLPGQPFEVDRAGCLADAARVLARGDTEVILLDLALPDSRGAATLRAMGEMAPDVPVVVLTGHDDDQAALDALKHGAQDYLVKGRGDGTVLRRVLHYAIERKQAELALRRSEARFRDYAASSSDWFWETDAEFRYTYVSERFALLTGADPGWLLGRAWRDTLWLGQAPDEATRAVALRHPFRAVEVELALPAGSMHVTVSGVPVHDPQGRFLGYRGTASDITEQRRMRDALREAKERAEEGARAKSSFLAIMGHEVKTPLHGILGMAHLLLGEPLGEEQHQRVKVIADSGEQLLSVLDGILDFTRLEAGRLPLQQRSFSLPAMLEAAAGLMAPLAAAKGIALDSHVDPALGQWWDGDPIRLRQIVVNLLSNAIKFTEHGRVTVTARPACAGIVIEVADTGIGIGPEHQGRLFSDFSQVDSAQSRAHSGSGLGLAICKRLVTLMQGTISVQSTAGAGSAFRVELPLRPAAAPPCHPCAPAAPPAAPRRVLLVEDHEVNRLVAAQMLSRAGHVVVAVADGQAALEALDGQPFDAVLMDLMLPGMDGEETARRMRAGRSAIPPILAFTAHPEAQARWRQMGFDGFVAKPLRPGTLEAALDNAEPLSDGAELAYDIRILGPSEVAAMVALFERSGASDREELGRRLAAGDCDGAVVPAHRLGSAAASVHMPALATCFRRVERAVLGGRLADARAAVAEAELLWPESLADIRQRLAAPV